MKSNLRELLAEFSPAGRALLLARLTHTLTVAARGHMDDLAVQRGLHEVIHRISAASTALALGEDVPAFDLRDLGRDSQHGSGPEHLCAARPDLVLELYPLLPDAPTSSGARIGFTVKDVASAFDAALAAGATIVLSPSPSPFGLRAVVRDLDGHAIELLAP